MSQRWIRDSIKIIPAWKCAYLGLYKVPVFITFACISAVTGSKGKLVILIQSCFDKNSSSETAQQFWSDIYKTWTTSVDLVYGPHCGPSPWTTLWTTTNFEDEFYERSKLILRTLNGRNCVNKLYFLSGFWSPHIKRLFQFFLNSIPKEWKRSREEVVFLCIFPVSLCCVTTQQLCRRLGQEEIKHADWVPSTDFPFLDQVLGNVCLSAN